MFTTLKKCVIYKERNQLLLSDFNEQYVILQTKISDLKKKNLSQMRHCTWNNTSEFIM